MEYLVLARKYRPQGFSDMTGEEHVVRTLSNALESGRVAHALLFCGPRGCGKTTTARIVAKALNCEKGPTANPCGVCLPCREIAAGTDVDVQEIDAASNTGVDNVRELRESAKYLPAHDRFKIFIVDEVHMLSKAAFNAFLKTLEEPPGHVKFIFATTDPQALPDTILSRCQRHNFRLVPLKAISERVGEISRAEGMTIDEGAVALVARQAAGSMRDALSILDQLFSAVGPGAAITEAMAVQSLGALDRGVVSSLAVALLERDAKAVLESIGRAYDGGHDLKRLAEDLAAHLRDLVATSIAGAPLDLPDHEVKALRAEAGGADPAELARLFDLVHGALFEISRAAQPRHALEIALLKAVYLAPSVSVQSLLGQASELARRLGGEPPTGSGPAGGGGPRPRDSEPAPSSRRPTVSPPVTRPAPEHATPPEGRERNLSVGGAQATAPAPSRWSPPLASISPEAAATPAVMLGPARSPGAPLRGDAAVAEPKPWERRLSLVSNGDGPPPAPSAADAPRSGSESGAVATPAVPASDAVAKGMEAQPIPGTAAALTEPQGPQTDAGIHAAWAAAVEAVRSRRRVLASLLEHVRPLVIAADRVVLGVAQNDFHARGIADEHATVAALLSEVLGRPVRLELQELSDDEAHRVLSLADEQDRAAQDARAQRLQRGREHPAIQLAVRVLGAQLEDVRDLGGSQP